MKNRTHREADLFPEYRDDPVGFMRNILGFEPWRMQAEVAQALVECDRVSWRTCNNAGKTVAAAAIVLWFVLTRPDSVVITTAPRWEEVRDVIWRNVRAHSESAPVALPGSMQSTVYSLGPSWFAKGLSSSDANKMAGYHGRGGTLLLVEEAAVIEQDRYRVLVNYLTTEGSKMLMIANPTRRSGYFADSHLKATQWSPETPHGWRCFKTSAYDVPAHILRRDWITEREEDYGPDPEKNPAFQVHVLGEFPTTQDDALFPLDLLEECAMLEPRSGGRHMGVDVARMGTDSCVATLVDGGRVKALHRWEKRRYHESAAIIRALAEKWEVRPQDIHVDSTGGYGAGPVDELHRVGIHVDEVDFGSGPDGDWSHVIGHKVKFKNRRQELHYIARRLLEEGMLAIPEKYHGIWADAVDLRYRYTEEGFFEVEKKVVYKTRTGRSPDHLDSLLCALSRKGGLNSSGVSFARIGRRRARIGGFG